MTTTQRTSLFSQILAGMEPGKIVARNDEKRFAIIQNIHPEGAIHWMAVPFEYYETTEAMIQADPTRFAELVQFAIAEAHAHEEEYPQLGYGFTVKFHFGAYETVTHAKVHLLSVE